MSLRAQPPRSARSLPAWLRLGRIAVSASIAAIVAYHLWLLLHRLLDSTIAEWPVLSRWLAAAALGGAAWALRHHRRSPLRGRAALVFWLLVLVLHLGPTPFEATAAHGGELWLVLPIGAASGIAFELLRAPVGPLTQAAVGTAERRRRPLHATPLRPLAAGLTPAAFAPRPPPFARAAH